MNKKPARYEDLLSLPENVTGEILAGELHTQPRPARGHVFVESSLSQSIGSPFQRGSGGPGGWWILVEPELHLGPDVLVPDLAGWRRERMPVIGEGSAFDVSPDWVCEILSPSTRRKDRVIKLPLYVQHGVGWVWLVDPGVCVVQVFEAGQGSWIFRGLFGDADKAHIPPFDAVELDLATLWPPLE
jgi:Uma2 family endonuclease